MYKITHFVNEIAKFSTPPPNFLAKVPCSGRNFCWFFSLTIAIFYQLRLDFHTPSCYNNPEYQWPGYTLFMGCRFGPGKERIKSL